MARSIEEIDAELAEVDRQIAMRNALGYKMARTKAILDHDTSGLDRVYAALNAAEQNRIAREAQQAFQAGEAEKTRAFQGEQNDLNRKNTLDIALMNKQEAAAERARKEAETRALKMEQARPEYLKIQNKMLEAVDAGNLDEAAILKSQMEALEAEHGARFGSDAQGLIDAREKAIRAKSEREKQESIRLLRVNQFLNSLPTVFRNEKEKQATITKILNSNVGMTTEEKNKEIARIRGIVSGSTKVQERLQGAVAEGAAKDYATSKEEKDRGIKEAKAAYKFQQQYPNRPLTQSQKDAIALAEKNKWNYKE